MKKYKLVKAKCMTNLSVIIPFYQTEHGLLRRSINSIVSQNSSVNIKIITIDDGSPADISAEVIGIKFPNNISLEIVKKANGGVSSARNAGLDIVTDDTDYIAFLDSDDVWNENHLSTAVQALHEGRDLYFSDNERPGFHKSYFQEICPALVHSSHLKENGIREINNESFIDLLLRSFPSQISTAFARWNAIKSLRFEETFKMAGEDMIYVMRIALAAKGICFTDSVGAVCGKGMNIYFSSINWQSPRHIPRLVDELQLYKYIENTHQLSQKNKSWAKYMAKDTRRKITYFLIRNFIILKKISPIINYKALNSDKLFFALLPINIPISIFCLIIQRYYSN
jgi:succinoglycan biosynthesis protein ExoW